jgi:hypothetical protein
MKKFNKLNKRDWKVKIPYKPTEQEQEIINSVPDTQEDLELKKSTIKNVVSKSIEDPTEDDLAWLNALEVRLKKGMDLSYYNLSAIEVMREVTSDRGIEYSGIFNYYIGSNLIQKRF